MNDAFFGDSYAHSFGGVVKRFGRVIGELGKEFVFVNDIDA